MARLSAASNAAFMRDARGAVYVEFLLAFPPVFLLFLWTCQLALVSAAKLVVQHAAYTGVRSAVVVLEAPPEHFSNTPRGSVSGSPHAAVAQQGARMGPVRSAAYMPLLVLVPPEPKQGAAASVAGGLLTSFGARMAHALRYVRAMSVVTLNAGPERDELAAEPIAPSAPVTVHVTFLYECTIPVIRALMCQSHPSLFQRQSSWFGSAGAPASSLAQRFDLAEGRGARVTDRDARFVVLTGEATMPNQGAAYYRSEENE